MTVQTTTRSKANVQGQRELWRINNRGILGRVAKRHDVSYTFVKGVFRGGMVSAERRVERTLHELGCPGFEEFA